MGEPGVLRGGGGALFGTRDEHCILLPMGRWYFQGIVSRNKPEQSDIDHVQIPVRTPTDKQFLSHIK